MTTKTLTCDALDCNNDVSRAITAHSGQVMGRYCANHVKEYSDMLRDQQTTICAVCGARFPWSRSLGIMLCNNYSIDHDAVAKAAGL